MPQEKIQSEAAAPRTAGELRRLIAQKCYKWIVDPRLRDTDLLPKYPRGGSEGERANPNATVTDVADLLRRHPPSNPLLRARWVELGLLAEGNQHNRSD